MPTLSSNKLKRFNWDADGHVVFDTETTGGAKGRCAIIQMAACALDASGTRLTETFCQLINTTYPITLHAQRVHGITREKLDSAPGGFAVVGKLLVEWLERVTVGWSKVSLVAHNGIASDFRLLAAELAAVKLELPTRVTWLPVDTLDVIRKSSKADYHSALPAQWPKRRALTPKLWREGRAYG